MLIAQISDCHITEPGALFADRVDSADRLRAAIRTLNDLDPRPDLVLGTGDLVNDGTASQYDRLDDLLAPLDVPFVPVVGNHDDRSELRARFPDRLPPGRPDQPIDFTIDDHPVRLIVLDTTIPGRHDGQLTGAQLAWLDERLAEWEGPTMVVQHHPPFPSGIEWMDSANGMSGSHDEAAILDRHRHVAAVVCGHLHRSISRSFGSTTAIVCPSTAAQLSLDLGGGLVRYADEPAALMLHHWLDGAGLASHVVAVGDHERWTPSWVTSGAS